MRTQAIDRMFGIGGRGRHLPGATGRAAALAGAVATALLLGGGAAMAQGMSLDSFDLDSTAPSVSKGQAAARPSAQGGSKLSDCLVTGGSACSGSASKSSKSFSLDDLQNLGVIEEEPEPVAVRQAATPQKAQEVRAAIAVENSKPLPSIDIEVLFAYNNDQPLSAEYGKIYELATALQDPRLADKRFVLLGHTDAAGSDNYNLDLSQRRAESLADALVRASGLPRDRFVTSGRGERDLKNPYDPDGAENRRVQILLVNR
ncbi:OmpA family protein [Jiella sonneratiae]|uniref:OmpA family protein n=1 Tax=Jiella sonneratiae TaxID=2816856 RepID=A0ABS3J7X6_9HYPH|nr:OmpA family protein [Jiella sonneratiae]MBO0905776.1 OmpA family protein [Jiella sonneratiae]